MEELRATPAAWEEPVPLPAALGCSRRCSRKDLMGRTIASITQTWQQKKPP
jgi:hypothetical protein